MTLLDSQNNTQDTPPADSSPSGADNQIDSDNRAHLYKGDDVLSIREFAPMVGKSRPTVSAKIRELTGDPGSMQIGLAQGSGKSTLLNREDQERLAAAFGVTLPVHGGATDTEEVEGELLEGTDRTTRSSLSVREPGAPGQNGNGSTPHISVYQPLILNLQVTSTSGQVDQALKDLKTTLGNYSGNEGLIDDALLQQAQQHGAKKGAQLAVAETNAMLSTKEQATLLLLREQGLLPGEEANATDDTDRQEQNPDARDKEP